MKKFLSLLLLSAMLLSIGGTALAADMPEVTFAYMILSSGNISAINDVAAEISKITEEKVGVKFNILPILNNTYAQQMTLMITSGEKLDLMMTMAINLSDYVASEKILPLNDLLAKYGQGIVDAVGAEYLKATTFDGEVYAIPTIRDFCRGAGLNYDVELAKKYNIDMSKVTSLEDMEPIFEIIKAGEGEHFPCLVTSALNTTFLNNYILVDALGDGNGVLMNFGADNTDVVFYEETEEFKKLVTLFGDWYKKGYVQQDIVTSQEEKYSLMRNNLGFCYFTNCKPGITNTASRSVGRPIEVVQLEDYFATTAQVASFTYTIPQSCDDPEATMKVLNLLYTDPEVATLLGNGIEGVHYQVLENGQIDFPEGVNATTTTYFPNTTWAAGNQFITPPYANDPIDLWEQQAAANEGAIKSLALGFTFDSSNVAAEIAAITNVRNEYERTIENGAGDIADMLPKYIQALKDAGIEKVIAEKQAQLDAWLANK